MEMTFYDDSQSGGGSGNRSLKRPATLDLANAAKARKYNSPPVLTTPDLNMVKMPTPEMEKLILNMNCRLTPTPSGFVLPLGVTEEQENYAKGFIDALNHLHQQSSSGATDVKNPALFLPAAVYLNQASSVIKSAPQKNSSVVVAQPRPPSVESTNTNSSSCSSSMPLEFSVVKEELQRVPGSDFSSPPCSPKPIDMADQERIKLERKRYRNRIAASKCRRRKLEKISQLEAKVSELKGENAKLEAIADKLREQVYSLKETIVNHAKKGCEIMVHNEEGVLSRLNCLAEVKVHRDF